MAMAFRGLGKPIDQLDISIAPSGGGFGPIDPGMSMPSQMPAPAAVPQKRGASFAGIAADFLAGMAGQQGPYAANVQRHNELIRREQQQQQQRMAERDDWLWKLQQKQQFPDPVAPSEFERRLMASGIMPGTPEWVKANKGAAESVYDPVINASVGGRDFFGPRSLLMSQLGKGGDPISPAPGATPPASAGPGAPHLTVDQMRSIGQGVNFSQWQQREGTPVLVTSAEEMARVPAGTMVISPDGRRGVKK